MKLIACGATCVLMIEREDAFVEQARRFIPKWRDKKPVLRAKLGVNVFIYHADMVQVRRT